MNKEKIKSTISIEFGLNKLEADKIIDTIFEAMTECFQEKKNLEIGKFGKFKIVKQKNLANNISKSLKFIPANKLAKKINHNFDELKKIELQISDYPEIAAPIDPTEQEKKFLKEKIITADSDNNLGQRKLISDDLVKLHREITEDKDKREAKNIWG